MSKSEFSANMKCAFGDKWERAAALHLDVSQSTLRRWALGITEIPTVAILASRYLKGRRAAALSGDTFAMMELGVKVGYMGDITSKAKGDS